MKKILLPICLILIIGSLSAQQFYKRFDSDFIYNPQLNKYINFIYSSTFDAQCAIEKVDTIVSDTFVLFRSDFVLPFIDYSKNIYFKHFNTYDTIQHIPIYDRLTKKIVPKYTIKLEKPDGINFLKYLGNDLIIGGSLHLFKVDLNTQTAKVIMDYDNPTFIIIDMAFKGDELVAIVYNQTNKPYCSFYKLDLNNPNIKEFLFASPDSLYWGDGLMIIPTACNKYNAYYIGSQDDPLTNNFLRDYYQLDLETGKSTKLCRAIEDFYNNYDYPFHHQKPGNPFCNLVANLDADKSTGAATEGGYQSSIFCAYFPHIADEDVVLASKIGILDSIQCFFESGDIDNLWKAGNEVLTAPSNAVIGTASFEKRDFQHWVLKNNGKAMTNDTFIPLLHSVGYQNLLGNQLTERTRKVGIVFWAGTTRSDTVFAYLHAKGKVNAGSDTSISLCPNSAIIQLSDYLGKHDSLGTWQKNGEVVAGIFVNGTDPFGKYEYLVNKDACRDTASITIKAGLVLNNLLGTDTILCDLDQYTIQANPSAKSYKWQDNTTQNYLDIRAGGYYSVTVTSEEECMSADTIKITMGKNTYFTINTTVCTFQWLSNLLKSDTVVCMKTLQSDSCTRQVCIKVTIDCKFAIPNAFTPNGDGTNDTFGLIADENNFTITSMKIYDRWGKLVYEGANREKAFPFWNGQINNDDAPSEVYTYILQFKDREGKTNQIKGEVLLIR